MAAAGDRARDGATALAAGDRARDGAAALGNYLLTIDGADFLSTGARAMGEYLSTHAKEIEAWFGGGRFFKFDSPDYVIYVGVGQLLDEARFVWIAGDYCPYRTMELEDGKAVVFLPPFVFKYFKKDITSRLQLKDALRREFYSQLRHGLSKAGYKCDEVFLWLDDVISNLGASASVETHTSVGSWPMIQCTSATNSSVAPDQSFFEGYQTLGDHLSKMNADRLSTGAERLYEHLSALPSATELIDEEGGTIFHIDCPNDDILHVGVGELMDCGHFIWVAGDYFPYRVNKQRGETVVFTPPFVFKVNKGDLIAPGTQIKSSFLQREMYAQVLAGLSKAGYRFREIISQLNDAIPEDMESDDDDEVDSGVDDEVDSDDDDVDGANI